MFSSEHHLAELVKAVHAQTAQIKQTGDKMNAAVDHLTASVAAMGAVVQGILDHEKQMDAVIAGLQAAAATVPADQSVTIEAAASAIDASLATLKGTIPAAPAPAPIDPPIAGGGVVPPVTSGTAAP